MTQDGSGVSASNSEIFLVECLAWGLLRAYAIEGPPVPVREMVKHPISVFGRLSLLEVNLGLYDAAYRSCLDGSRLIAVDLCKPPPVQRASIARALYVAFCCSARAAELGWAQCERPYERGVLFARCLLMPAAWVRRACAAPISMEQLAARFDVPIWMVEQRLPDLSIETSDLTLGSLPPVGTSWMPGKSASDLGRRSALWRGNGDKGRVEGE